jgi:hypothetical protein
MNVLTDKFNFDFQRFNAVPSTVDWDEMDLQLFDGTATVKPDINSNATVKEIEEYLGLSKTTTVLGDNSETNKWGVEETSALSATDLNQPLKMWLSNDDASTVQSLNFSTNTGVKKVNLYDGDQAVAFNGEGGNFANVDSDATGSKTVTFGNGGDAAYVQMGANNGDVALTGGTGNDSIVVNGAAPVSFDLSKGGADKVVVFADTDSRISLTGYSADDDVIVVQDKNAGSVDLISFADGGVVKIGNTRIDIDPNDENSTGGWLVNLQGPGEDAKSYKVGFTSSEGGTVDASKETKSVVLIGNASGQKTAGSTLIGGSGDDTVLAGGGDKISVGAGKDLVSLVADSNRDGANVNVGTGRTTIVGSNTGFDEFTSDTVALDGLDVTKTKFQISDGNLIVKTDDSYVEIQGVSAVNGVVNQLVQNGEGQVYRAAIGAESSTFTVAEDDEQRAYAYIGKNSTADFSSYTGEANIDLENYSSIGDKAAYFEGVNHFIAGEGNTTFMGGQGNETLSAGVGNASLYGGGGRNVLQGYDNTNGDKVGNTTFFALGRNDGAVSIIENFEFVGSNNYRNAALVTADALETNIENNRFSNVAITEDGDLLLEVTNNSTGAVEKLLISDALDTTTSDGYTQDFVVNGVVAQVGNNVVNYDQYADFYFAQGADATVKVDSAVTDEVKIWLSDSLEDRGKQFEGDFKVIDARSSNAVKAELAGNANDNIIYAGTGSTSLWGGNGGNDTLVGNSGVDNFYYALGDGNDVISNASSGDVINLLNMTLDDISVDTISSSAVVINFNSGGSLTVNDGGADVTYKVGDATYGLDENRQFVQK